MASIASVIAANGRRWNAMHFSTGKISEFAAASRQLVQSSSKAQYQEITKATGVPWGVIAVAHLREGNASFHTYLGNGQPLGHVTTIVPKGRGPFLDHPEDKPLQGAFYRGALDALLDVQHAQNWHDWTPGGALTWLETFNGLGYANMGLASPYIWGGTSEQQRGKYTSDGHFDPNVMDSQLGCAGLLRYMTGLDPSVGYGPPGAPIPVPVPTPVPTPTPIPVPIPTPVPTPEPPNMAALLQLILGNPTLMALFTSVISNPALVQTITQILNQLSSQVGSGVPPATAIQNLILTQHDLEAAADAVKAEVAKLGLTPWTRDQEREMAAVVIRSYIANVKAGK